MSFTFDFPVLIVVDEKPDGVEPLTVALADNSMGVAAFTEQLLAERCRDSWRKNAKIVSVDKSSFREYLKAASEILGAKYASFDPHPAGTAKGKSANVLIADILGGRTGGEDTFYP